MEARVFTIPSNHIVVQRKGKGENVRCNLIVLDRDKKENATNQEECLRMDGTTRWYDKKGNSLIVSKDKPQNPQYTTSSNNQPISNE